MAALTGKRALRTVKASHLELDATASQTYHQGALVGFDTATGLVDLGAASTTLIPIGTVAESKTLDGSGGKINVKLFREMSAIWMVNAGGGDAVVAGDIGGIAYVLDDQTVANNDATNTRSVMGRIWKLDSTKGVLVEPMQTAADQPGETGLDEV